MANEKVDVVIVGAGASGSVFASALAKAGKKVVIFDNGPDWKSEDLVSSEMWGRRIRPAGPPFLLEGKNPFGYVGQAGWGVGGAALHYFANLPRYLPTDFKMRSEHKRGLDWPISYEDLAPFYDKVAAEIGVSGDAKSEEIWRPAGPAYPMPPMKIFKSGEIWKKAADSVGMRLVPAPVGMNSREFKGREACIYDGWCAVGCPTGALANPVVTYLVDARAAKAEVRAMSTVTRVLTNPQGTRATGVEYYDAKNEKQVQDASVVVLAAWAGQNPRIMLNSASDKHPNGLANKNSLVGKYMMTHHIANNWVIMEEDVQPHMGTVGAQYMSYDRYPKTTNPGAFGSSYIVAGTSFKTHDYAGSRPELFGPALATHMKRAARGLIRMNMFGEELPNIENRIELATQKDEFGMPLGRIVHSYDQDAIALWNANLEAGAKVAKATGAKEMWQSRGAMPTSHLHGGTIMGTSAESSVVDSYGRTHEVPNLWVAGPGVFPTEGASNPTFTIFAVSQRGAEQLVKNWSSVAG